MSVYDSASIERLKQLVKEQEESRDREIDVYEGEWGAYWTDRFEHCFVVYRTDTEEKVALFDYETMCVSLYDENMPGGSEVAEAIIQSLWENCGILADKENRDKYLSEPLNITEGLKETIMDFFGMDVAFPEAAKKWSAFWKNDNFDSMLLYHKNEPVAENEPIAELNNHSASLYMHQNNPELAQAIIQTLWEECGILVPNRYCYLLKPFDTSISIPEHDFSVDLDAVQSITIEKPTGTESKALGNTYLGVEKTSYYIGENHHLVGRTDEFGEADITPSEVKNAIIKALEDPSVTVSVTCKDGSEVQYKSDTAKKPKTIERE